MGQPVVVSDDVVAVHQRDLSQIQMPVGAGVPDFAAMIRIIDKIDPSWRD